MRGTRNIHFVEILEQNKSKMRVSEYLNEDKSSIKLRVKIRLLQGDGGGFIVASLRCFYTLILKDLSSRLSVKGVLNRYSRSDS